MTIKVTEKGQPFRIATNFNMSSNTALEIIFTAPPNGTDFTRTKLTTPAVSTPPAPLVNDPELGSQSGSTYFEYTTDGTEFDVAGEWSACAKYTDASLILNANKVTFTIGAECS